MAIETDTAAVIECLRQVDRYRRQARRAQLISVVAVVVAVGSAVLSRVQVVRSCAAANGDEPMLHDALVARRVTIVDADEKPRIELGACGEPRLGSFGVCLLNPAGATQAALEVDKGGMATLRLYDEKGPDYAHRIMEARSLKGVGGSLVLFDGKGGSVNLGSPSGEPGLTCTSAGSKHPQVLFGLIRGLPRLMFIDSAAKSRMDLELQKDQSPRIRLMDDAGRSIWTQP